MRLFFNFTQTLFHNYYQLKLPFFPIISRMSTTKEEPPTIKEVDMFSLCPIEIWRYIFSFLHPTQRSLYIFVSESWKRVITDSTTSFSLDDPKYLANVSKLYPN